MSTTTPAAATHLPAPMQVRELLEGLLDKEITVRPGPPYAVSDFHPASIGVYADDSLIVRAVVVFDLPLSAYAGAALALVPPTGAAAAIEERKLGPALAETLHEVFNIAASLFNTPGSPHVKLYAVHTVGEPTPPDVKARTQVLGRRLDLHAEVAGYGKGRFSVVLV